MENGGDELSGPWRATRLWNSIIRTFRQCWGSSGIIYSLSVSSHEFLEFRILPMLFEKYKKLKFNLKEKLTNYIFIFSHYVNTAQNLQA